MSSITHSRSRVMMKSINSLLRNMAFVWKSRFTTEKRLTRNHHSHPRRRTTSLGRRLTTCLVGKAQRAFWWNRKHLRTTVHTSPLPLLLLHLYRNHHSAMDPCRLSFIRLDCRLHLAFRPQGNGHLLLATSRTVTNDSRLLIPNAVTTRLRVHGTR